VVLTSLEATVCATATAIGPRSSPHRSGPVVAQKLRLFGSAEWRYRAR